MSTLEEEGKAAEGRRGNEGRGEERGNLRSDYSGEEEEEYKEEEGKGKYARGRQSRKGVVYVQTTAITAFSLQDTPPQSTVKTAGLLHSKK